MFDIIVVGAGSAGAVIANRTSEDPNRTVLLLDAGPDYPEISKTPFDLVNSHNNSYTEHDWHLKYAPTPGRNDPLPRGKVTGGSSAVNTTIALRGMPEDYDEWADLGNTEWSWEKVLPAFNRLERDLDFGHEPYHGDAGPITIRRYPESELLIQHQAFLESAGELGYPYCADANDPAGWGAGPHPMNKLGRLRVSTAVGYLAPARIRPNLTIQPNSSVRRLIVKNGICHGVEVERADGNTEEIHARLIVLSAGAVMSPAILMRSGLGPAEQLRAHGIDVEQDIPGIGENLSDHPCLAVVCQVKDSSIIDFDQPLIQTILRYTAEGSEKRNDLQIEQISFTGSEVGARSFMIASVLEYQYGRGNIKLRSADPAEPPKIENQFCNDERDVTRLTQCFKDTINFVRQGALADLVRSVTFPNLGRRIDDDFIANLCKRRSVSGFHPCGTVKMGLASDPLAVIDQHGRFHKLDNLVVADASIMPAVTRANTNLTSIMIGEMIGEWIRTRPATYGL